MEKGDYENEKRIDWTIVLSTFFVCAAFVLICLLIVKCTMEDTNTKEKTKQMYTDLERCAESCPEIRDAAGYYNTDILCMNKCLDIEEKSRIQNAE